MGLFITKGVDNSYCCDTAKYIAFFIYIAFHACGCAMPAACGDFIFLRAQKNEAKKERPCGELAQRKSFLW